MSPVESAPAVTVEESVLERFSLSSYRPVRSLACRFEDGVLTLQGRVPTFYLKQVAQQCCVDVQRVREVVNQIEVAF